MAHAPLGWWRTTLLWALGQSLAFSSHALTVDERECQEAAEFVRHAAVARHHGMSGADFLARLEADLAALSSFPPALRWFARDAEDAALLRQGARQVFDDPRPPTEHETEFLGQCTAQVQAQRPPAAHADAR